MKIRPVTVELYHAYGRTDGHNEANSRFSQCCEGALKRAEGQIKLRYGRWAELAP